MRNCVNCGALVDEDARFCEKCGTAITVQGSESGTVKMQAEGTGRRQSFEGEVRKCPNCGDPIDAFEFVCDKCGYNFSTNRMSTSQEKLAAQLQSIDARMPKGKNKENEIENLKGQKATVINTFPVANSIEEIVSFMMYAAGNIDMSCVSTSHDNNNYSKGDHQIADAWIGKMDQMYQMAKMSFSNSPKFQQVETIYQDKKKELKKASVKKILTNPMAGLVAMMAICFLMLGVMGIRESIKESRAERLGKIALPASSSSMSGKDYLDVEKMLRSAGFTNIELEANEDLVTGWITKDGSVEKVSVEGNTAFSNGERYFSDANIVITYHTFAGGGGATKQGEEISDDLRSSIVGTYVGVNGSVMVLFPDGAADYYWKDWEAAEKKNKWRYESGNIVVFIPEMYGSKVNIEVTADIGNGNTEEIVFKSDSTKWDDEEYIKVDSNAESMAKTEYDKLIVTTLSEGEDFKEDRLEAEYSEVEEQNASDTKEIEESTEPTNNEMPVMPGSNLKEVMDIAEKYGLSEVYDDDFGNGTRCKAMSDFTGGLNLDIIYASSSKEILCGNVVTNNLVSSTMQQDFIKSIAVVLCPSVDSDEVSAWVSLNVGNRKNTHIGEFSYELDLGPVNNALYYAGYKEWEQWGF